MNIHGSVNHKVAHVTHLHARFSVATVCHATLNLHSPLAIWPYCWQHVFQLVNKHEFHQVMSMLEIASSATVEKHLLCVQTFNVFHAGNRFVICVEKHLLCVHESTCFMYLRSHSHCHAILCSYSHSHDHIFVCTSCVCVCSKFNMLHASVVTQPLSYIVCSYSHSHNHILVYQRSNTFRMATSATS